MSHVLFRIFFSFLSVVGEKVINRRKNYFLITICLNVQKGCSWKLNCLVVEELNAFK
ncbi:hypothetical protein A5865_000132 [Enterococcus sp. 12E11_DIV0728]|uniref:Uncharacterized protein n=1 Tax=Enterococcus gilvus ATCC BAA-350 TaxID=1158614 RepID=R2VHM4_9ENTE|nr:hypothetical protein UKC_01330 [Enterococcus gilvus ATCC BAA-350]EOW83310.1 hypothetical protein I592_02637 [Enterococcus gilvus ATCC BAA-350]OTO76278.1 hypothetical protein A5865_000132 [Enterococcus sp. 12E11_DIV0728]OUZ17564.1 hypothetical protein A5868_002507 [Enterococcus sp. 12F9_DIV0723]